MPRPSEYQHASEDFDRFLCKVIDQTGLATRNQAYTTAQGVLYAFRRRLSVKEGIRFAGVLPAVVRALFVADWDVDEPQEPFADRAAMTREAQSLRRDHSFFAADMYSRRGPRIEAMCRRTGIRPCALLAPAWSRGVLADLTAQN